MNDTMHTLEQRLAQLEAQVADLLAGSVANNTPAGPTVLVAPVQIVNAAGQLLATLEQRVHDLSLRLFNHQGIAVAALGIDGTEAGYVTIRNAEGTPVAVLDVEIAGARLHLTDHADRGGVSSLGATVATTLVVASLSVIQQAA